MYSIKLTLEQLEHIFATISNGDTEVKVLNLVIDYHIIVNLFHVNITTQQMKRLFETITIGDRPMKKLHLHTVSIDQFSQSRDPDLNIDNIDPDLLKAEQVVAILRNAVENSS